MSVQQVALGRVFGDVVFSSDMNDLRLWEFQYAKNQVIPLHEHRHAYICFLIRGDACESDRSEELSYSQARLMFIPSGCAHQARMGPDGAHFLGFELREEYFRDGVNAAALPARPYRLDRATTRNVMHAIMMAAREPHRRGPAAAWPHEVLGALLPHTPNEAARWIGGVMDYLHANVAGDLDIRLIARMAGRHPTHMMRAFKNHTGLSIGAYHRNLKIDLACRLIRENRLLLTEIAQICGFADQSHFIRVFRNTMNASPSAFRRAFQ